MSSLFQDSCCGSDDQRNKTKCKGCICELLNQLANQKVSDLCSLGERQTFLIKQKGTSTPVSLDGTGTPTEFQLERFDPETCCAVFSFEEMTGGSPVRTERRTFIEDCRSIAGIVCLGTDNDRSR
ncbi:MAG TPA: hypothetical protein VFK44_00120 [Bacillales bacterium]|nr:hypothetical protein [Bacillales bacterium]